MPYVELLFGFYIVVCIVGTLLRYRQITVSIPFLLLFAAGYFYVSFANFYGLYIFDSARKAKTAPTPTIHLPPSAQGSPQTYPEPRRETA